MFNSALIYELAVLKMYAEPLLFGIGREELNTRKETPLKIFGLFCGNPKRERADEFYLKRVYRGRMFSNITKTMEVTNIVFSMAFFSLTSVKKVLDPFFLCQTDRCTGDLILLEGKPWHKEDSS